jgi:hypothetical protein
MCLLRSSAATIVKRPRWQEGREVLLAGHSGALASSTSSDWGVPCGGAGLHSTVLSSIREDYRNLNVGVAYRARPLVTVPLSPPPSSEVPLHGTDDGEVGGWKG